MFVLATVILPLVLRSALGDSIRLRTYSKRWIRIAHLAVYYFCIAVVVLMQSVELAGLARIDLGIGLLWVVYVGCVFAAMLQATKGLVGMLRGWQIANIAFWITSSGFGLVKLLSLIQLAKHPAFQRTDGSYGISHQIVDDAIGLGFHAILIPLEISLLFMEPWGEMIGGGRSYNEYEMKA